MLWPSRQLGAKRHVNLGAAVSLGTHLQSLSSGVKFAWVPSALRKFFSGC